MTHSPSPDGYLRVAADQLSCVALRHLDSEIDSSILQPIAEPAAQAEAFLAGTTEWWAQLGNQRLSLGWDWYRASPGTLAVLRPDLLRTNVLVVDSASQSGCRLRTLSLLLGLIHATDWQNEVTACLRKQNALRQDF